MAKNRPSRTRSSSSLVVLVARIASSLVNERREQWTAEVLFDLSNEALTSTIGRPSRAYVCVCVCYYSRSKRTIVHTLSLCYAARSSATHWAVDGRLKNQPTSHTVDGRGEREGGGKKQN